MKLKIFLTLMAVVLISQMLPAEELPKPSPENVVYISIEHSTKDSSEIDYIKNNIPYGLYAWPVFSVTHLDPAMDWHAAWDTADTGIAKFKSKVNSYVQAAKANNVKLHIVMCAGLSRGLELYREAKEEDIRNCQWYNDNKIATVAQISETDALDEYVFGTLSRYARKMQGNLSAKAKAALAFLKEVMNQEPDIINTLSGWGEAELNFNRIVHSQSLQDFFCDFSPFAVLEFCDWIRHTGMYDDNTGAYAGEGYTQGGTKYQGASGLSLFNQDFGTNFLTWNLKYYHWDLDDDYDPDPTDTENNDPHRIPFSAYEKGGMKPGSGPDFIAGGFDPPRAMMRDDDFWELWNLFRETMVGNYVLDVAKWASEAGIPVEKWFSHQLAGDYLFGTNPEVKNKNSRYYSSASPLWTADIRPYGSPGATLYDIKFPNHFARSTQYGLSALAALSNRWAVMEYDAETYPEGLGVSESSVADILEQYLKVYSFGPQEINFWRWKDGDGSHQIKGRNKETALKQFIGAIRDKAGSTDLNTVYDPPRITGFSGEHNSGTGSNVLTISRKIWPDHTWKWKEWGDFSRFEVFRGETPGFLANTAHRLAQITTYIYTDESAVKGKTYYYKVKAVNSKGVAGLVSQEIRLPKGSGLLLTLMAGEGGTTDPVPGIYEFGAGEQVEITAVPDNTYSFYYWSGDASGDINPLSLLMDRDKNVTANFSLIQLYPPVNIQGEVMIYQAWIVHETNHYFTWEPDSRNQNVMYYRLYERENGALNQVAEVSSDVFEYLRRSMEAGRIFNYELVTVDVWGNESVPSIIALNTT